MKIWIIIFAVIMFAACTPEKDLQVQAEVWTLVKIQPHGEKIMLTWLSDRDITYTELVWETVFTEGTHIINRVPR